MPPAARNPNRSDGLPAGARPVAYRPVRFNSIVNLKFKFPAKLSSLVVREIDENGVQTVFGPHEFLHIFSTSFRVYLIKSSVECRWNGRSGDGMAGRNEAEGQKISWTRAPVLARNMKSIIYHSPVTQQNGVIYEIGIAQINTIDGKEHRMHEEAARGGRYNTPSYIYV